MVFAFSSTIAIAIARETADSTAAEVIGDQTAALEDADVRPGPAEPSVAIQSIKPASPSPAPMPPSRVAALPKIVRVGVPDWGGMPFDDYNGGNPQGFNIDLLEEILGEQGIRARFVPISNTEQGMKALCDGQIDIASNLLLNTQRTRCVAYTDPILELAQYGVRRRDDRRALDEESLKRMRMAIPEAMLSLTRNRQRFVSGPLTPVPDTSAGLRAVNDGGADVLFDAPHVLQWYLHRGQYPNLQLVPTAQLPVTMRQRNLYVLYVGSRSQLPLLNWIDAQIKRDPVRIARLRAKWLADEFDYGDVGEDLSTTQRDWLANLPKLRIALADNAAPVSSRDGDGNAEGIAPDYAHLLEDRLGVQFQQVLGNGYRGIAAAMLTGAADLAILPVGSLPGDHWVYSDPIERTPTVIVTAPGSAASIGLESLAGKRVSVTQVHRIGRAVMRAAPDARVVGAATEAEGMRLLLSGKVDAHVGSLSVINRIISTRYESDQLQVAPSGMIEELAFVADRRLAPLMAVIDERMAALSETERQRIHSHWVSARYNYGLGWSKVIAILIGSILVIAAIAAGYLRLRHESRRREQVDRKLREVAGNLPGVVFKAERSGRFFRFTYLTGRTEPLFAVAAEQLVADETLLYSRVHPDDRLALNEAVSVALHTRGELNADFRVPGENGAPSRWVRLSALPRPPEEDAEKAAYTGYFVDVTDAHAQAEALAVAKEQAEAATRAKSGFLATMSHEIRTPMSGMVGMLELLEQSGLDDDQSVLMGHMQDSARSLQAILDDILDVSKIEAGHVRIEQAPLQPRLLADSVAMHMAAACRKKGLRLDLRVDAAVAPSYLGDMLRLRQVLLNLLGNAVKFTERGGVWLHIALAEAAQESLLADSEETKAGLDGFELLFEVGDSGIGMNDEQAARVFEPFHQADDSTSRRFGGTGLGLSICRSLVELMGGSIRIDSREGVGTRVIARVPMTQAESPATSPPIAAAPLRVRIAIGDARRAQALAQSMLSLGHRIAADDGGVDLSFIDSEREDSVRVVRSRDSDRADHYLIDANPLLYRHLLRACEWARDLFEERRDELRAVPAIETSRNQSSRDEKLHDARILVAEDSPVNREVIRRQLAQLGYTCELCDDGLAALDALRREPCDLLLTDCQMPSMDGYALARAIRAEEARKGGARLPIVAITASALPEQVEHCLAAGMDAYLIKPVRLPELSDALAKWLPVRAVANDGSRDHGMSAERSQDMSIVRASLPVLLRELPNDIAHIDRAIVSGCGVAVAAAVHRASGSLALFDAEGAHQGQALEARLLSQPVSELTGELEGFLARIRTLHERLLLLAEEA